jgi:lipoprotein-releasing system permease protein
MVEKLYSEFDSDIVIRSARGKTFNENQINFSEISKLKGVNQLSRAVEEVVVLKNDKKWVNSIMIGVDSSFLEMSKMKNHILEGFPTLNENNTDVAIIGATLLDDLGSYISKNGYQTLQFYVPKRNAKVKIGSNPFITKRVGLSARMNFNREVNAEFIIVPIALAREMLEYDKDITSLFIEVKNGYENEFVKEELKETLGNDFIVKTNYEKNELIFKTSKTEKIIVLIILLFIFILAAFNLVASLTMLFVEKMDNIKTMISFGADKKLVFKIFYFEGLMISLKGIFIGLMLGYFICLLQIYGNILQMPNSGGESFPIKISINDSLIIFCLVTSLSFLASFLPVKYLIKRNFENEFC